MDNMRKSTDTLIKNGNKTVEQVDAVAETAWEKGRETFKEWRGQGQEAFDRTLELAQKHPGKSIGLALLVGVAIGGALMAMRKDS